MSLMMCGMPTQAVKLPDAGGGYCCEGAAFKDAQHCTCWVPILDQQPSTPIPAESQVRPLACADCAYRPDSPERNGADGYQGNGDELDDLVTSGTRFFCHQGIPRAVQLRHPMPEPDGTVIEAHAADYEPIILDGVPYRADGRPADICAGWAARRAAYLEAEFVRVGFDVDSMLVESTT